MDSTRAALLLSALWLAAAVMTPTPASGMGAAAGAMGKKKPSLVAVDVVTCKMKGNKDKKDDCNPSCVCQKMAWTLEFNPQLRTATKTTQICELWMEGGLIDKTCAWVCAGIANNLYGSQGTDPDVCAQAERELNQVSGGDTSKIKYSLLEQHEGGKKEKRATKPPSSSSLRANVGKT
jgi:hypothetical protein